MELHAIDQRHRRDTCEQKKGWYSDGQDTEKNGSIEPVVDLLFIGSLQPLKAL